jgi:pilus assembly protein TadC
MTFPLYIFFIIYLSFLLVWLAFSFIGVYHMLKFGFLNLTTFFSILIYITIAVLMLSVSYKYLSQIDWRMNITIFGDILNISL